MSVEIYKCFIASPSDTNSEREKCDNVFLEINKTIGEQLNFRIESIKWENDSIPGFGEDGQDVINKQLLVDYDIFIGMMWNKFGTPTKRAGSGTEEEFNHAYNRYINQDNVEIMLYFNEVKVNPNDLDIDQFIKVKEFKSKVVDLGALYSVYQGNEDFEKKLKRHLTNFFIKKLSSNSNNPEIKARSEKLEKIALKESLSLLFKNNWEDSLCMFTNQPIVWVDPVLSKTNEISQNADDNYNNRIDIEELISNPTSTIIKSPPLFGLTSLAHYLVKKAWEQESLWIYLDAKKVKRNSVDKSINRKLEYLNINKNYSPTCILLDGWDINDHGASKLLKNLSDCCKDIPIIVMQRIDDNNFRKENNTEIIDREFNVLHLLALPRNEIRKVVSTYNKEIKIGEENQVLNKVVSDLDALNIHRTPLNCLTLLKVSEKYFDESPVNRTKMLEMVLFVLFDLGDLPTYKIKPDLKDCEYVLGKFCEQLIKADNYKFTRKDFLKDLESFCNEKLIDLEVSVVFDILYGNNIIIERDSFFVFRATYWIYYFGAKRMYISKDFCNYILDNEKYTTFPEIIEFYTGIDRNRSDALAILNNDLKDACDLVKAKTGLPEEVNPYKFIEWKPKEENLIKMQEEISEDVLNSKLPEALKDKYADRDYNQLKPYDQSIKTIFHEYSLALLAQKIRASSRALRNSDYVEPEIKKELLNVITDSWDQFLKILIALIPVLANKGKAHFQGLGFILASNFGNSYEERTKSIIRVLPSNVVRFFKDDLFSEKIGPLLFDGLKSEKNQIIKHNLILLLVIGRPRGWKENVSDYIAGVSKNSFYLYDVVQQLRTQYRYAFADESELKEISFLLKMGYAKHEFGIKKPGLDKITKISNEILPKREFDEDEKNE